MASSEHSHACKHLLDWQSRCQSPRRLTVGAIQDEAYWPAGMEDKRAMTSWMALDDVSVENGCARDLFLMRHFPARLTFKRHRCGSRCMWFVPATHAADAIRKHRPASAGSHVLTTDDIGEAEGHPVPLKSGSAVIWHGRSLHYAGPNTTDAIRRTYIANYRPETMIQFERENGRSSLGSRLSGQRNI